MALGGRVTESLTFNSVTSGEIVGFASIVTEGSYLLKNP